MKVKVNMKGFSTRLKTLPTLFEESVKLEMKLNACEIIDVFKRGLIANDLGLEPLKAKTITQKAKQGFPYPDSPLVGKDGNDKRTYKNMLEIREGKKGYTVYPSVRKHWKSKLRLLDLFRVHSYGRLIQFKSGKVIRIPPRPALFLAYQRYMNTKAKKTKSKKLKTACVEYINSGKRMTFDLIRKQYEKDVARIYGGI